MYKDTKSGEVVELDDYKKGAWVSVVAPKKDELYHLADKFKLDSRILIDVLDEDEMPRLEKEGNTEYLFTRFVYLGSEFSAETQVVLLVVKDDFLLTISSVPIPKIDTMFEDHVDLKGTNGAGVFLRILHLVIDSYDRQLTTISRQVKSIRHRLRRAEIKNQDFVDFVVIEEELNEFLTVLTPTAAVLKRLLVGSHIKLSKQEVNVVQDLMLNTEQSIVESGAILQSIVNIREAYSTIATNNLNRIIRILTVLTTVLAVPTLIGSLYGMNVRLPIDSDPNAFWLIIITSAIISATLLIIFKLKKWL